MKLATLKAGGRDGTLVVVSRDLKLALPVPDVAPTLQAALDDWVTLAPELASLYRLLNQGGEPAAVAFDPRACAAPLPRAYQWADGSAYLSHVERVSKARDSELPPGARDDPLMYQGGSDAFLGPYDDIAVADAGFGIDFEAEVAVITDDVPMGVTPSAARHHVKLVMLVNDVSLRALVPGELGKGFGFFQSKPASAFSPVAASPEALGHAWDGGKLALPMLSHVNGAPFGRPHAGRDMAFDFPRLIAHAARTRRLGAGTIIGSGTVSNLDPSVGYACIMEKRMVETIETGRPQTPFLRYGDRVRIEMLDQAGHSIFGAIDQQVVQAEGGRTAMQ
jgi:fumarylacetoacetate (FAA) hydrolase